MEAAFLDSEGAADDVAPALLPEEEAVLSRVPIKYFNMSLRASAE